MTDIDFKRELASMFAGEPTLGPDVTRALRGGRRAQARHRYISSAAGLAGVAVIAGAVPFGVSFLAPGGSSGVVPGAGSSSPAPVPVKSVAASSAPVPDQSNGATPAPVPGSDTPTPSPVPTTDSSVTPSPVPNSGSATPSPVPSTDRVTPTPEPNSGAGPARQASVAPSPEPTVSQPEPSANAAGLPSPVPSYPGWKPTP